MNENKPGVDDQGLGMSDVCDSHFQGPPPRREDHPNGLGNEGLHMTLGLFSIRDGPKEVLSAAMRA